MRFCVMPKRIPFIERRENHERERERETWLCSGATSISHEKGSQRERERDGLARLECLF